MASPAYDFAQLDMTLFVLRLTTAHLFLNLFVEYFVCFPFVYFVVVSSLWS